MKLEWHHQPDTPIHNEAYFTDPSGSVGGLVVKTSGPFWDAWAWWPKQKQFKIGEWYKTSASAKQAVARTIKIHSPAGITPAEQERKDGRTD